MACAKRGGDLPSIAGAEKRGQRDELVRDEGSEHRGDGTECEDADETRGLLEDAAEVGAEEKERDCEGHEGGVDLGEEGVGGGKGEQIGEEQREESGDAGGGERFAEGVRIGQ